MGVNGIYGLSGSGLDIDSMVKVGMMSKQNEYDKMAQKYTKNEWMKSAYIELSNSISTFNLSKLSDYKMSTTMNAKTAVSSNSEIKATAAAGANVMSHRVVVDKLAANAYLVGTDKVSRKNTSASDSIKLADAIFKGDMKENDTNSNQVDVTYGAGSTFHATFNKTDTAIAFEISDGSGDPKKISYTYGDLFSGKTFNDLVSKINNSGLNIKATYDSVYDRFSFYNSEGGETNTIQFKLTTAETYGSYGEKQIKNVVDENGNPVLNEDNTPKTTTDVNGDGSFNILNVAGEETANAGIAALNARDFINNLNLKQSVNGVTKENKFTVKASSSDNNSVTGVTGSIRIDGATYETTDNKVNANGIIYDVSGASIYDVSGASVNATSTVTVTQDVDAIVDKVKSFVEDYNKLLSSLYEKYDEKPDSNYKPLTQAQKDAMKDEQVEKWEEKAKKGILYHDQTLGKIILNMRSAISNQIELSDGTTTSAYSIGISTVAGNIKGQITLDETKLRAALAEDPDSVYKVFASLDSNDMENTAKSGIAQRLGDVFTAATKSIRTRAGTSTDVTEDSDLNNLLRQLQTKMSNFKKMMDAFEDKLYKKYDTMESTLAKLGTQLNFISGVGQG